MKVSIKNWQVLAMSVMVALATSCDSNNNDNPSTEEVLGGEGNILLETTLKNIDGASGQTYLQQISELSGTLDLSKGIQTGFSSTLSIVGNDVYLFPETGTTGKQCIYKYQHTAKGIKYVGEMQIIPNSSPYNLVQVSATKAYVPLYNLGKVMIINPTTMQQTGEIDLTPYAHGDNSADPAAGLIRDGYFYLALDQIGANWMPYDDYRQIDVAVIDINTDKVVKIASENETALCFPTRPHLKDMIFQNEQNDIYIACAGYFGYNPEYVKTGFVCIPAGSQSFDASKTWDISKTSIEGCPYKAVSIYNCKYLGNSKVAAYVGVMELMTDNPYTARNSLPVIIDLKNKTIKKIEGIPYTDGHSVAIECHNGEVYFSSYGVNAAGIFAYNPTTETVKQVLSSTGNIAFFHFFE